MKTEIKFAIIFVLISFIGNCIEFATGLQSTNIHLHPFFVTPFFIILIALIYLLALREKRNELGGKITFRKALLSGTILTLFITILNPFFLYIFSHFINPDFFDAFARYEVMTGKSTKQEAEDYFNFANFLIRGSIYRLIMGITATLIITVFLKKDASKK